MYQQHDKYVWRLVCTAPRSIEVIRQEGHGRAGLSRRDLALQFVVDAHSLDVTVLTEEMRLEAIFDLEGTT